MKPKSEFSKNVLTLMTGTSIAQAIPIAISPILTRIYSPEDFGLFALYMSIVGIFAVIATARYESAIILPKKDEDAINIVALSMGIAMLLSVIIFFIIYLFNNELTILLNNDEISLWLYFVPFAIFISGINQSLNYWTNRKKKYKRLAVNRVLQSTTMSSIKLSMGFNGLTSSGLIVGTIVGQTFTSAILGKMVYDEEKRFFKYIKILKIIALFKKYINFIKFSTPGVFFQTMSTSSMSIFINIFFNTTIVGLYYFANSMLRAPLNLIFSSLTQVYSRKAVELYQINPKDLLFHTQRLQKKILYFLLPFTIFMFVFAPFLFKILFGDEWEQAGVYIRYFLPLVFFNNLFVPISALIYILDQQKFEFYWKISFFIFQILSLYISSLYFSFEISILIMSIFGSLHYVFINYYLMKILKYDIRTGNKV